MSNIGTNHLDTIVRIYKNAADKTIGIHCIGVHQRKDASPTGLIDDYPSLADRRRRSVHISADFQRFNLEIGGSRIIATVQMIGRYDDFILNPSANDFTQVVYNGRDDEGLENDLVVSLEQFPTVGDSL